MPTVRTIPFTASGQLIGILGKKLINENSVAVLELIKNAYDADATEVIIKFSHLQQPAETRIVVEDNGDGMSADDIEHIWMTAGVSPKRQLALEKKRTTRGRILLGEMGIGRFATQRLGNTLVLVSRKAGHPEVTLRVNWDEFEYADRLGDVECKLVEEDTPRFFTGDKTGTRVVMSGAPDTLWTEDELAATNGKIRRLLMPGAQPADFKIVLEIPEFPRHQEVANPASLDRYHFALSGSVDARGVGDFEIITDVRDDRRAEQISVDLWSKIDHDPGSPPRCGAFSLNVRVFMKQVTELRLKGVRPDDVRQLSGVSVFRDSFRVLPYGDPGDDWLQLDKRRINDMAKKFGNEQIIGFVSISAEDNLELLDQANRLGLQKNVSYHDFTRLILQALTELEKRSYEARQTIIIRRKTPIIEVPRMTPLVTTPSSTRTGILAPAERGGTAVATVGLTDESSEPVWRPGNAATPDPRIRKLERVFTEVTEVANTSEEPLVLTPLSEALNSLGQAIQALSGD